jgi:hypothetical protein
MIRQSQLGEKARQQSELIDVVAQMQPPVDMRTATGSRHRLRSGGPSMLAERYKTIGIAAAICAPRGRCSSRLVEGAVRTRTARGPASRRGLLAAHCCRWEWAARLVARGGSGHVWAHSVGRFCNSHTLASAGGSRSHPCSPTNRRHGPANRRIAQMRERLSA